MLTNRTYLIYSVEKQSADIREFNVKLQQLKSKVSNNSDGEIEYVKTDLNDFRSNSDDKGLVDYTWQNASNNESVLTFDFKGKNIELENLPYTGEITATPIVDDDFVAEHNIIYGDINTAIASSSTIIDRYNKYKINFENGKLKLPEYSAGLFCRYDYKPTTGKFIREIDLTNVDMNNIVNASNMFSWCDRLTSLNLGGFTGEKLVNASNMFNWCVSLTALNLSNFTGENLTSADRMFGSCDALASIDLSNFTGASLENASVMFIQCTSLISLDLSKFTGENLTNAQFMFGNCYRLTSLNLRNFTGENVTNTESMFRSCSVTSLDLSKFTGENVTNAEGMFFDCKGLITLDLSNFTGGNLSYASDMFNYCSGLASLIMKGSAINIIISLENSYLSLDTGVTVENDKTYDCTCTYDNGVKITAATEV